MTTTPFTLTPSAGRIHVQTDPWLSPEQAAELASVLAEFADACVDARGLDDWSSQ